MNTFSSSTCKWGLSVLAAGLTLASCNTAQTTDSATTSSSPMDSTTTAAPAAPAGPTPVRPAGPAPAWATGIKPEMQTVIEALASLGGKPIETLSAQEARQQPTPADAVMKVMQANNMPMPPVTADTMSRMVMPGVKVRIYTPKGATGTLPVVVYYHGGGWVIANLDTYDASVRGLVEKTGAIFVSVAYRQAPELKFPTAHNDSFAAYQWVLRNAASFKGDPQKVAVVGESAGGNLAASVSMMARDKKVTLPKHQVLVYPIAGYDMNTPSYQKNAQAKPLNKPMMAWFFDKYLRTPADGKNPMISLVNANLKGMPPTTIITASLDPLMSDGEMLASKLKAAGVATKYQNFEGVTHEFFGMAPLVPQATEAQSLAAGELKNALMK
ncbi:alpha/beta hydrolase fold domain-containing protein [Hymenobacter endophyticus]|uniref:Alpha/beta hydrolase fold domain-containing protein n=1 Tax=Hymenobacter endophyticus TaxID=3076335 RepID=A0ABU3TEU4_9BACT|nr:alpha/beta hydrolase fold domain-containing protein [Hymenobacter endophyticus]MDU0369901.1 alpha/beta hydrolase fold domain-containing protein [Hymenobacter endophyticus]